MCSESYIYMYFAYRKIYSLCKLSKDSSYSLKPLSAKKNNIDNLVNRIRKKTRLSAHTDAYPFLSFAYPKFIDVLNVATFTAHIGND